MTRAALTRTGLAALGALHLWWGAWAYVAPGHFYDTFPGLGHRWVAAYPPYNEHLVSDLGATFLTLAVLLGLAALRADRQVTRVVLTGVIVFSGLHLLFHLTRHGGLTGFDLAASLTTLVAGVLLPAMLFAIAPAGASAAGSATDASDDRQ